MVATFRLPGPAPRGLGSCFARPQCLCGTPRVPRVPRSTENRHSTPVVQENQNVGEPLYLEPFLRAFLLGVGSGALLETAHVAMQFFGLVGSLQSVSVIDAIEAQPTLLDSFAPLWAADHAAALAGWVCFYLIDVLAIKAVLDMYHDDSDAVGRALSNLVTLPKRMLPHLPLPLRLAVFRQLFAQPRAALASVTAAAAAPAPTATPTSATIAQVSASAFVADSPLTPAAPPRLSPGGSPNIIPAIPPLKPLPAPQTRPPAPRGQGVALPTGADRERRSRQGLKPGQLDPEVAGVLARRQKEVSDRRSYLYNQWYAAALSESVKPGQPLGLDILGRRVVLFRDSDTGQLRCMDDACPHRGAPLSAGWMTKVEGHDCVVCPYHGWALDGAGRLRDVPAAEHKGEWPKRSVVPVHSVQELGGFVWLFYGSRELPEGERPPIPFVPELADPAWKPVYGEIEFQCNHFAVFENAIDMAHIHYLHSDTFGNQGQPEIRGMECTVDAHSVTATFRLHNKPVSALWEWSRVPEVSVTAKAMLPSTSVVSFTLGNGLSFTTFVNTVPVGADRTVNRFALVRNLAWDSTGAFNADAWDTWARKAMLRILGEDKAMVERLRPDLLAHEYSVRADLPQVAFRKLRQQYVDLGFGRSPECAATGIDPAAQVTPDF